MSLEEKLRNSELIEYHRNTEGINDLLIVGLNDSQGVNTTLSPFKKGLLEYIASSLRTKDFDPLVINAFSLTINKTEHIDYFLKNNLSLEAIKLSQIYSAISALEKLADDLNLPRFIAKVANIYRLVYQAQKGDEKIGITTSLRENSEPTLIYSSGVNNMMRIVGSNPFAIKEDYLFRNVKPNFNHARAKAADSSTVTKTIDSIKTNFENILGINQKTDIYSLGAYIPKSLDSEEMKLFKDLILRYNESLKELCEEYGATYIDTQKTADKYNKSKINFHINNAGQKALANEILFKMHRKKLHKTPSYSKIVKPFQETNLGLRGIIDDLGKDVSFMSNNSHKLMGAYYYIRGLEMLIEKRREKIVFIKVQEEILKRDIRKKEKVLKKKNRA